MTIQTLWNGRGGHPPRTQTTKLPSDTFLWGAIGSIGVSATLQLPGKQKASLFVGQWVAPFLLLGVYNKIVKVAGSDRLSG